MPKKITSVIMSREVGVFIAVYECGSYSAGARRANLSREAAVKAIQRIDVGGKLFVRHRYGGGRGFGVQPTSLADRLYKVAKLTINLIDSELVIV